MLEEVNKAYILNKNIILKGINKKFWALDTNSGSQFRLNELSFDILSAIDGKTTIKQIIDDQFKKYAVDKETLAKDVCNFIELAIEKGFIA